MPANPPINELSNFSLAGPGGEVYPGDSDSELQADGGDVDVDRTGL